MPSYHVCICGGCVGTRASTRFSAGRGLIVRGLVFRPPVSPFWLVLLLLYTVAFMFDVVVVILLGLLLLLVVVVVLPFVVVACPVMLPILAGSLHDPYL